MVLATGTLLVDRAIPFVRDIVGTDNGDIHASLLLCSVFVHLWTSQIARMHLQYNVSSYAVS